MQLLKTSYDCHAHTYDWVCCSELFWYSEALKRVRSFGTD